MSYLVRNDTANDTANNTANNTANEAHEYIGCGAASMQDFKNCLLNFVFILEKYNSALESSISTCNQFSKATIQAKVIMFVSALPT